MRASNYTDCLDAGITPKEGSQYYVAPFIQAVFNNLIKIKRPDIAMEIKGKTAMLLE